MPATRKDRYCRLGRAVRPMGAALLLAAAGCGATSLPPVELDTAGVTPSVDYAELGEFLDKAVSEDGELLGEAAREHADVLLAQLRRLAVTGPRATPALLESPDERLAYWYNARAAWAIRLAVLSDFEQTHAGRRILTREFPLDGRRMSLEAIDDVLAGRDDFRVLVASPGVHLTRAALPTEVFAAETIRQRIDERFQAFLDDPRRVEIDVKARKIRIPPVLWRVRGRVLADFRNRTGLADAPLRLALLWCTQGSAHRRLQNAVGYDAVPRRGGFEFAALLEDAL